MPPVDKSGKPPTMAYELVLQRDRSSGRAVNLLLIVGTLATNWVLLFASPVRLWGLYLMLLFVAALLLVDVFRLAVAPSTDDIGTGRNGSAASVAAASFLQNDLRVYILVWIFWLVVSEFFFLSRTWFGFWIGFALEAPMLIATFVVSMQHYGHRVARAAFPLLALLALAFPTRDWMPQHEWWPAGVLRVALFFFAVLVAGYALPHRELRFDVVRTEVATALAVHPKNRPHELDEEDVERTASALQFAATVAECQNVCLHETERTLTIAALSVWILLVSRVVVLFFGLFLVIVQLIIFFVRRSEYEKLRVAKDERLIGAHQSPTTSFAGGLVGAPQVASSSTASSGDRTRIAATSSTTTVLSSSSMSVVNDAGNDDTATDDGDGSIETTGDADEASGASDSMDQIPLPQPPAQSSGAPGPIQYRTLSGDDVRRRSPPTSVNYQTSSSLASSSSSTLAPSPGGRAKTKPLSISKPEHSRS